MIAMPGRSHDGPLPPLTEREAELAREMRRDVETLSKDSRSTIAIPQLNAAADYVESRLRETGREVRRQTYRIEANEYHNLEIEIPGTSDEIVIVGAHYDAVFACPGANDNASGVAGMLALARIFANERPRRTLRFVAFTNEEPPRFWTDYMGSRVYARRCRERNEKVVAMLSLETIGYYSDEKGSQKYPAPFGLFYPSKGNFIAFVGNLGSRGLVRRMIRVFRETASFPSEGGAIPGWIPGVGWSDHWSFWKEGYDAVMVTDTAPFRYPHYHTPNDTPEKLDYEKMSRVVNGLVPVLQDLTR